MLNRHRKHGREERLRWALSVCRASHLTENPSAQSGSDVHTIVMPLGISASSHQKTDSP